jgi:hypothetical protein
VAVVGDEVLVGRARPTAGPPATSGAVHVFRASGGVWSETGTFKPGDTRVGDGFGAALSADGNLLAVGAPRGGEGRGAVYLFSRSGTGWGETARLTLAEGAPGDLFGAALVLRGALLVVGAPGRDSSRGATYAFRRSGATWGPATEIGRGAEAYDRLGSALALADDRVLAGAPGPMGGGGPQGQGPRIRAGAAIVYRAAGERWVEEARLASRDSTRAFGQAVATDGASAFRVLATRQRKHGAGSGVPPERQ